MGYILKLGSVDISDYVEAGYKINIEPVYGTSFVNMLGEEVAELIGQKVSISANLGELPTEIAKKVCNACDTDELTVSYATPVESSATFKRPKLTSELITESDGGLWDISLTMNTDVIRRDGL